LTLLVITVKSLDIGQALRLNPLKTKGITMTTITYKNTRGNLSTKVLDFYQSYGSTDVYTNGKNDYMVTRGVLYVTVAGSKRTDGRMTSRMMGDVITVSN